MTGETRLLLDTHFWIWGREYDNRRISRHLAERLDAAAVEGRLLLHPISAWEVGLLVKKRRLTLDRPVRQWLDEALHLPGIRVVEFTPEIAMESALLEAPALTDPVDRILVATAQVLGATLLTSDRKILDWAAGGGVRVMEG
jgi:PIN domain nuclease of toxin-antitoxin system